MHNTLKWSDDPTEDPAHLASIYGLLEDHDVRSTLNPFRGKLWIVENSISGFHMHYG